MPGMNDIKARIKSVESTMQITKAMELVATSKLRRAKENVEKTRPFYEVLGKAIETVASVPSDTESIWLTRPQSKRRLLVVFAGDRGLAGGFNSNILNTAKRLSEECDAVWLPIGKKALEFTRHRGLPTFTELFGDASAQRVGSMLTLGGIISEGFRNGEFGAVTVIFTEFLSMLTQRVVTRDILPFADIKKSEAAGDILIDQDPREMLDMIVPSYIGGILYSALCESLASESAARRTAMNSANKNAEEMIEDLMLGYNRARQALITQEITEIVSGAEAL